MYYTFRKRATTTGDLLKCFSWPVSYLRECRALDHGIFFPGSCARYANADRKAAGLRFDHLANQASWYLGSGLAYYIEQQSVPSEAALHELPSGINLSLRQRMHHGQTAQFACVAGEKLGIFFTYVASRINCKFFANFSSTKNLQFIREGTGFFCVGLSQHAPGEYTVAPVKKMRCVGSMDMYKFFTSTSPSWSSGVSSTMISTLSADTSPSC
jgi:hypothetical protein